MNNQQLQRLLWRWRVWRIKREAERQIGEEIRALERARKQHKATKPIQRRMVQKRMEMMR